MLSFFLRTSLISPESESFKIHLSIHVVTYFGKFPETHQTVFFMLNNNDVCIFSKLTDQALKHNLTYNMNIYIYMYEKKRKTVQIK